MQESRLNYIIFIVTLILIILFFDRGGMLGLVISGVIIMIYIYLFQKDVTLAFVLCLVIISNPVNILNIWSFGYPTQLPFSTVFFALSFLVVFSPQIKERRIDPNLKQILFILILFTFYQILVSFLLKVAPNNLKEILRILYRYHEMYLGIYLIIPSYIIFREDGKKFINAIAIASIIYALATIINVYTSIDLFLVRSEWRNGAVRIFLLQSYIIYFIVFLAIAAFTFFRGKKTHIHYYLGGILAMTIPLIAMYRLELFTQFLTILLVVFIVSKYLNRNLAGFVRLIKVLVVLTVLVLILFPDVYHAMADMYIKTFQELLGTGEVERGTTQTRTEHELPLHLSLIRDNPILGVGWRKEWFADFLTLQDWGFTDVPLTSTLAMYGWLGMLIYYSRFLYILPLSKHVLRAIGKDRALLEKNGFLYIVVIALRAHFIAMLSFRLFYIGYELTKPEAYIDFGVLLGIYFASIYLIKHQNKQLTLNSVNHFVT